MVVINIERAKDQNFMQDIPSLGNATQLIDLEYRYSGITWSEKVLLWRMNIGHNSAWKNLEG